jgi:plasmid stabilization system protein ParE
MAFDVYVTRKAQIDIDEYALTIAADSVVAAARWKDGLERLIVSLDTMPGRFSVIQEAARLGRPYRSVNYHSHRIIFRIDEAANAVYVVRVYHSARAPVVDEDLR